MEKKDLMTVDIIKLAYCPVLTPTGDQVRLGQLWSKQTAVFVFLRHFACIACRAHAAQIWNEREKYEKAGGRLIFIGNGQPQFIKKFQEDLGIEKALVLTDPTLESFRAAGFHKGFFYVVQPLSVVKMLKLATEGHRQTRASKEAGTHWQLGGIVAINSKGTPVYQYISEHVGDFPDAPNIEIIESDESS